MSAALRICVHGHAYQPPREDPRTGVVPVEPTARPFRDWNERITAECYAPCTVTRLHDAQGRVTGIVNLFAAMSFDLGPTLAHWLERHARPVLERIVAGDRRGRTAVAHPYHHVILPLAHPDDALTELCWGVADFRHRFGREPEGMWLPETAVDAAVLGMLDTLGLSFTVLAPTQVHRVPPPGTVGRVEGSGVTLVVYDGPASHDLAFGAALRSGHGLAERMVGLARAGAGEHPSLAVAAADMETFGHHHTFSERAIGHALYEVAPGLGVATGGLAALLDGVPRVDVGAVHTSAWSCAHGVERWRSDCGCVTGAGPHSHQRWRAPLRRALEVLRDDAVATFRRRGETVFHDPMAARDGFGVVLADPAAWDDFVTEHVRPLASTEEARLLLDAQEATLASFTSCGWFYADLAGPEPAIVLSEARRSVELLQALGEAPPLEAALRELDRAEGAGPGAPGGRAVWELAREQRASGAPDTGLLRWDRAHPLDAAVAGLAARAVAGEAGAAEQAMAVVEVAVRAGRSEPFAVAQETVYDALVGAGRDAPSPLVLLGDALGLATDAVRAG